MGIERRSVLKGMVAVLGGFAVLLLPWRKARADPLAVVESDGKKWRYRVGDGVWKSASDPVEVMIGPAGEFIEIYDKRDIAMMQKLCIAASVAMESHGCGLGKQRRITISWEIVHDNKDDTVTITQVFGRPRVGPPARPSGICIEDKETER